MNMDRHARQTLYNKYLISNLCHTKTPKWKGSVDFTACLPIFFGFSKPQNPYMPNLVLSAGSEGPFHISAPPHALVDHKMSITRLVIRYRITTLLFWLFIQRHYLLHDTFSKQWRWRPDNEVNFSPLSVASRLPQFLSIGPSLRLMRVWNLISVTQCAILEQYLHFASATKRKW